MIMFGGIIMTDVFFNLFLLIVGFLLLMKGADYFIDGASSVAAKFNIPMIIIGLTVAAFGTSLPEAAVSINAAIRDNSGISVGNIIGSNIFNILIILGISAIITPLSVRNQTVKVEMPIVVGVSALLAIFGFAFGNLSVVYGIIQWLIFIAFLVYLYFQAKKGSDDDSDGVKILSTGRSVFCILIGLAAIVLGSDVAVEGATAIAQAAGVSDRVIGLTIVACGTSLPELITSTKAALRGNADLAVGNIVGSNIFNILFILGTSSLISPLAFGTDFLIDAIISIAAVVLLLVFCREKRELKRWHGIIFIILYAIYFVYLFVR